MDRAARKSESRIKSSSRGPTSLAAAVEGAYQRPTPCMARRNCRPTRRVRYRILLANRTLLIRFQMLPVDLLSQAFDQRRGLTRTGWAQKNQARVERKAKDFALRLIKDCLYPQLHGGLEVALQSFKHVGSRIVPRDDALKFIERLTRQPHVAKQVAQRSYRGRASAFIVNNRRP